MKNSSQIAQSVVKRAKVSPPRLDEAVGSLSSCATPTAACMSVSLQVVADVRVGVLVVVAARQLAELPVEALAAGIVLPGSHQQSRPQSRNDSTSVLSRGSSVSTAPPSPIVMWCADKSSRVARSPKVPTCRPVVGRAESVAAILDQPEIVLSAKPYRSEVERIAERVRHHDGPRPLRRPLRAATRPRCRSAS